MRIWFERRFSIIAARVMRATTAICGSASIMTGRIRLLRRAVVQPATGSQASVRPKTICRTGATTKFGMVMPKVPMPGHDVVDGAVLAEGGDGAEGAADDHGER